MAAIKPSLESISPQPLTQATSSKELDYSKIELITSLGVITFSLIPYVPKVLKVCVNIGHKLGELHSPELAAIGIVSGLAIGGIIYKVSAPHKKEEKKEESKEDKIINSISLGVIISLKYCSPQTVQSFSAIGKEIGYLKGPRYGLIGAVSGAMVGVAFYFGYNTLKSKKQ